MPHYDKATNSVIDASKFNGSNSAGGFRTTAEDLATFMEEAFKGFPGTQEYGQRRESPDQNPYFSDDTINKMMQEGQRFGSAGMDNNTRTANYQMAGFVTTVKVLEEIDMENFKPTPEQLTEMFQPGNIIKYGKTGEIPGSKTFADFYPQKGEAEVTVFLKENVTPQIANLIKIADQLQSGDRSQSAIKLREAEKFAEAMGMSIDDFIKSLDPELQAMRNDLNLQMAESGGVVSPIV